MRFGFVGLQTSENDRARLDDRRCHLCLINGFLDILTLSSFWKFLRYLFWTTSARKTQSLPHTKNISWGGHQMQHRPIYDTHLGILQLELPSRFVILTLWVSRILEKQPLWRFIGELTHRSPPGQNGRHFADGIFRCISVNEKFVFWLKYHWSLFVSFQLTINQHWFR